MVRPSNHTKGELLIHARNRYWLRPDAHLEGFLAMINFGSGLKEERGQVQPASYSIGPNQWYSKV